MKRIKTTDVLRTAWDVEFDDDFFVIVRPGKGDESMMVYAPKDKKTREQIAMLIAFAPKLLKASEIIAEDLKQRIDIAGGRGKSAPVFQGLGELMDAIRACGGNV